MKRYLIYWRIWRMTATNALQEAFVNRWTNLLFIFGKLVRLFFSVMILVLIQQNVHQFGGYTTDQLIIFFLTYSVVDVMAQIFYRGVYLFSNQVRTGEFDFYLAKPINPLFRALTGKPDINDTLFLIPTLAVYAWLYSTLNLTFSWPAFLLYLLLLVNSYLILTAMHIFVLVVGILTTEVDGIIWLYRDLMRLGQFPVSIYLEPMRLALFFLVPVGFAVTIPAEVFSGANLTYSIPLTLAVGIGFFWLSLKTWAWGVKKYSSASS